MKCLGLRNVLIHDSLWWVRGSVWVEGFQYEQEWNIQILRGSNVKIKLELI